MVVRLIAMLALALGLFASFDAPAQSFDNCYVLTSSNNGAYCADQGEAVTAATAYANKALESYNDNPYGVVYTICGTQTIASTTYTTYRVRVGSNSSCNTLYAERKYPVASTCSTRPATTSGMALLGTAGVTCNSGCVYSQPSGGTKQVFGGKTYVSTAGSTPTGASCSANAAEYGNTVTSDDCVTQGGLTQCMKSDGRMCSQASTGKQFCWSATEAGTKTSGNEAATKAPENAAIKAPSASPSNGGEWAQTAQGSSSTTSGGTTTNYSVTNWTSTYGTQGSGGGAEGDSDSGDGDGDDDDGDDAAGEGVGDLYKSDGKTVESVYAEFKGKISDAPVFDAVENFLGGCGGGAGTCPNESWDGGDYAGQFDLSQLCSGPLGTLAGYAGWVFLACMGIVGFRWALL